MSLTTGGIAGLVAKRSDFNPLVQIIDIKKVKGTSNTGGDRHKLVISDGTHSIVAMLTAAVSERCNAGEFTNFAIVKVVGFIAQQVQGRTLVILTDMQPESNPGSMIGNPQPHDAPRSGGPAVPPPAAAAPSASGAVQSTGVTYAHQPIASLNPYSSKWMIKARVTTRSDIRTWSNDRGEGKLFSVDLLDEHGTEIRATFFRDAVDKFHPLVEPEGVYYFSNGKLKIANKKFTSIKNDYEITFDDRAHIERAQDGGAIAKQHFDFVPIARLATVPPDTTVDIIGLVKEIGEVMSITTKAGREVEKRDLTLVDDSMASISLTLWGEKAKQPSDTFENAIMALKGAKLGDYNGRSMSTYGSTTMLVNPDIPETARVRTWADSGAASGGITALTERGSGGTGSAAAANKVELRKTLSSIHDEGLGRGEKGDIITVKAHITYVRKNVERPPWYPANPDADETGRKTFKKLTDAGDGTWIDERTGKRHNEPLWRYILSVSLSDETGSTYATCFNEVAEQLLGKSAPEMHAIYAANIPAGGAVEGAEIQDPVWNTTFDKPNFSQWLFTLRVKVENVNDEERVKTSVLRITPVNCGAEVDALQEAISQYS